MPKVMIIGGGISGLGFAYYCQKNNISAMVLEASGRVGGCIESHRTAASISELGAHSLYNSYQQTILLIEELGLTIQPIEKRTLQIAHAGQKRSLWSALHIGQLIFNVSYSYLFKRKTSADSCKQRLTTWCGQANYYEVMRPALWALLNQNPDEVPFAYLANKLRSAKNKNYPSAFSLVGGIEALIDALANKVPYQCNMPVTDIQPLSTGFRIVTPSGALTAEYIVLAVPAAVASRFKAVVRIKDTVPQDVYFQTQLVKSAQDKAELCVYSQHAVVSSLKFSHTSAQEVLHYRRDGHVPATANLLYQKSQVLPNVSTQCQLLPHTGVTLIGNHVAGLSIENCLQTAQAAFWQNNLLQDEIIK